MESGESLRSGLRDYFLAPPDDFTPTVQAWLQLLERGCQTQELARRIRSPARRHLLALLERGLRGEPILSGLITMDEEVQEQCLLEIDNFLADLPFRMLLPLLFFLFPAFVILLLGPLLMRVVGSMG